MPYFGDTEGIYDNTPCDQCPSLENEIRCLNNELDRANDKIEQLEEELYQLRRELTDSYGR